MQSIAIALVMLEALVGGGRAAGAAPDDRGVSFRPADESLRQYACPEWFRDAKFGIWAVWGPESVPMQGDWYARRMYEEGSPDYLDHLRRWGHPSTNGWKDMIPLWRAERWDPERLMALYQRAGAKYFCMIGMHHDNFDCWNSGFNRWNAVNLGPKRDIAGEWQKAAREHGLRFGMTEHLAASWWFYSAAKRADTNGPLAGVSYDGVNPAFADLYWQGNERPAFSYYSPTVREDFQQAWFNRIRDLIDRYHPDLLYSDSPLPYPDRFGREMLAHFYNDNRERHGGRLEAVYNCKEDSQGRWVQDLERGVMSGISPHPWQTDTCVGDWYYDARLLEQHRYKSAATVLRMLADIVSKNGNLLLNFPPRPDGTLDGDELKILAELAAWMPINGEAIFGTRPWQVYGEGPTKVRSGGNFNEDSLAYTAQDLRFTTRGGALYALMLGWPENRRVVVRSLAAGAGKITAVHLLGAAAALETTQDAEGLTVTLPELKPCDHVFALRIDGEDLKAAPIPVAAVKPGPGGRLVLRAAEAEIHGGSPRYELGGGKDQIGYWGDPLDFVSWEVQVDRPGAFLVTVEYSCAPGAEGSEFRVEVAPQFLSGVSRSTGSWADYTTNSLGRLVLSQAGKYTLGVKPKADKTPWKVIGLKSVTLTPDTAGGKP